MVDQAVREELRGVLEDIDRQPGSALFHLRPAALLRAACDDRGVNLKTLSLSRAEKHLVNVYAEEAAWLLRERHLNWVRGAPPGKRSGVHLPRNDRSRQRLEADRGVLAGLGNLRDKRFAQAEAMLRGEGDVDAARSDQESRECLLLALVFARTGNGLIYMAHECLSRDEDTSASRVAAEASQSCDPVVNQNSMQVSAVCQYRQGRVSEALDSFLISLRAGLDNGLHLLHQEAPAANLIVLGAVHGVDARRRVESEGVDLGSPSLRSHVDATMGTLGVNEAQSARRVLTWMVG
jgi:hypothetical protein